MTAPLRNWQNRFTRCGLMLRQARGGEKAPAAIVTQSWVTVLRVVLTAIRPPQLGAVKTMPPVLCRPTPHESSSVDQQHVRTAPKHVTARHTNCSAAWLQTRTTSAAHCAWQPVIPTCWHVMSQTPTRSTQVQGQHPSPVRALPAVLQPRYLSGQTASQMSWPAEHMYHMH